MSFTDWWLSQFEKARLKEERFYIDLFFYISALFVAVIVDSSFLS